MSKAMVQDDDLIISQRTLPEQVADIIVQGITKGVFVPGERLLESVLMERLKVSRPPIREALRILDAQGILVPEPQKGHRIARFDAKRSADCYAVRRALEHVSIPLAAARVREDAAVGERLREILTEMADHLVREDYLAMNRSDLAFHTETCRLSQNELLINLWRGLSRNTLILFAMETVGDRRSLDREYAQHVELFEAMMSGDDQRLEQEIDRHLTVPPELAKVATSQHLRRTLGTG